MERSTTSPDGTLIELSTNHSAAKSRSFWKSTKLEEHKGARPGVPVSLLFFVQAGLKHHVLKTDKQYSAFLNARGVR